MVAEQQRGRECTPLSIEQDLRSRQARQAQAVHAMRLSAAGRASGRRSCASARHHASGSITLQPGAGSVAPDRRGGRWRRPSLRRDRADTQRAGAEIGAQDDLARISHQRSAIRRRLCSDRPYGRTASTILPISVPDSISACAFAASASGNVCAIDDLQLALREQRPDLLAQRRGERHLARRRARAQRRAGDDQALHHDRAACRSRRGCPAGTRSATGGRRSRATRRLRST